MPDGVDGAAGLRNTDGFVGRDGLPAGPNEGDGGTEGINGKAGRASAECFEDATRSRYAETSRNVATVTATKKRRAPKAIWPIDSRWEILPNLRCSTAHPVSSDDGTSRVPAGILEYLPFRPGRRRRRGRGAPTIRPR